MPTTTTGTIIPEQADPTPRGVAWTLATNDDVPLRLGTVAAASSGARAASVVFSHGGGTGPIRASLAEPLMSIIRKAVFALNGPHAPT